MNSVVGDNKYVKRSMDTLSCFQDLHAWFFWSCYYYIGPSEHLEHQGFGCGCLLIWQTICFVFNPSDAGGCTTIDSSSISCSLRSVHFLSIYSLRKNKNVHIGGNNVCQFSVWEKLDISNKRILHVSYQNIGNIIIIKNCILL